MPLALILAFVASLGIHASALFGLEFDFATEPESLPLLVEMKPLLRPPPLAEATAAAEKAAAAKAKPRRKAPAKPATASATPVLALPESETPATISAPSPRAEVLAAASAEPPSEVPKEAPSPAEPIAEAPPLVAVPRLPQRMRILYRVDRGESNFEIGFARHEWEIDGDRYRLSSLVETTGIVWLFKAIRLEMESRGALTEAGLRPESFAVYRDGRPTPEHAAFDWARMTVRVGERAEQALSPGAQDLLSFNYQLGFLSELTSGSTLPIVTGKKYGVYRLEVIGDEEIDVPAGAMRTLHLRAPGENSTELWLAYDYLLLPVKIRHVNSRGESFVQLATQIQLSPPNPP